MSISGVRTAYDDEIAARTGSRPRRRTATPPPAPGTSAPHAVSDSATTPADRGAAR